MNKYKDYTSNTLVPITTTSIKQQKVKEEVSIAPNKATLCIKHKEPCHNPCKLEFLKEQGDIKFKTCAAFSKGENCRACGCDFKFHFHSDKLFVYKKIFVPHSEVKMENKQVTDEEKKKLYEIHLAEKKLSAEKLEELEQELCDLKRKKEESYQLLADLKHDLDKNALQASNANIIEYYQYQINQIQKEYEAGNATLQEKEDMMKYLQFEIAAYKNIENLRSKKLPVLDKTALMKKKLMKEEKQKLQQVLASLDNQSEKVPSMRESDYLDRSRKTL